jgi:hypothetical protein
MNEFITESSSHDFAALIAGIAKAHTVVWDFDGVVADTEPLQDASYRILAERRGWPLRNGYFGALVGKTEDAIWAELVDGGFPLLGGPLSEVLPSLKAERKAVFIELTEASLSPSWVARDLMPALNGVAGCQMIVSNGDPGVIESLMSKWQLSFYATVARREEGRDKAALVEHYCTVGSVLLEDNAEWLRIGKSLGATTIGVVHGYNAQTILDADYLVQI